VEFICLKAALMGQVVDGQAGAGVGVHTVRPACQHTVGAEWVTSYLSARRT
jgi:hypothetical protein